MGEVLIFKRSKLFELLECSIGSFPGDPGSCGLNSTIKHDINKENLVTLFIPSTSFEHLSLLTLRFLEPELVRLMKLPKYELKNSPNEGIWGC